MLNDIKTGKTLQKKPVECITDLTNLNKRLADFKSSIEAYDNLLTENDKREIRQLEQQKLAKFKEKYQNGTRISARKNTG